MDRNITIQPLNSERPPQHSGKQGIQIRGYESYEVYNGRGALTESGWKSKWITGLEAACTLGQRGYRVALAEADKTLGGRISRESQLPGLAEWARVRDWRLGQIAKLPSVKKYPDNHLDAAAVLELVCSM